MRTLSDVQHTLTVTGVALSAGTDDNENVVIHWGDGTTDTMGGGARDDRDLLDPHLTVDAVRHRSFPFSGTHIYSDPGVYNGTVSVSDWGGGTDTASFTATVQGKPDDLLPPARRPGVRRLGDGDRHRQPPPGQPVIFAASPASVCTDSGCPRPDPHDGRRGPVHGHRHPAPAPPLFGTADPAVQTFTVKPAPLTITADDKTKVYGAADPTFTASFDGLVNGDTKADLTGLTVTGAPVDSSVGQRPIVASGVTDPNYVITYVKGTDDHPGAADDHRGRPEQDLRRGGPDLHRNVCRPGPLGHAGHHHRGHPHRSTNGQ